MTTRQAFAHEATVVLGPGSDERAPGGSVTVELCGGWDHEPPCPLAPHHTQVERYGGQLRLRVLFATEPDLEAEVRGRIRTALERGEQAGPDGRVSTWSLESEGASEVAEGELDHARRLAGS